MKKHLLKYAKVLVLIFVLTILNNCSVDKEITESNGVHFSPKNKKFTYQNFKNETGKQVDFIKSVNLSSNSLSMRGYDLKTDFLIDTSQVVKYIDPQTFKETYTFKIYPFNIELERNEYFNLIYESVGTDWNQIIFLNKNKENPSEYESPVESSEIVYNALSTSKGRTEVITYNFHCTGTGDCASGICDMCSQCVSTTISYQYTPSMPEITENPGTGGGGGTGAGGTGAGGTTSGAYVPISYNSQDIDLESPEFQLYLQIHNYISTLPNDLNALFNNTSNHFLYPTVFNYLFTNGVNFYTTGLVNQALNKYKNFVNDFNPNWHNDYKDKFKLWALNQFMNAENENDILEMKNSLISSTHIESIKYEIITSLLDLEIDRFFAQELLISLSIFDDYTDGELLELTKVSIFAHKHNYFSQNLDDFFFSGINEHSSLDFIDPITALNFIRLFTAHCAIIKKENENLTPLEVYNQAYLDTVQLLLDFVGLVPVFGEWADLANGVIYTIQGDAVNATLSYAGAIPFAGWFSSGIKFAKRADGLKYLVKGTNDIITFGAYNSKKFREVCGIAVGDASQQAHHLIPRGSQIINHEVVQRAARANINQGFHIDQALNGIAVATWRNQPNHHQYNNRIYNKLQSYIQQNPNATSTQCYNQLMIIMNQARQAVINNPNVHLNNLIF